mgnify:CR=1 FL=1
MPDPRVTNPELFDLRNPDAPIPQFVNAMRIAGIEITAEQVAQGITYEALKDKDGNAFVVVVYNLDPSLFPEQYRELAGPIPLMIAERDKDGRWGWDEIGLNVGISDSITSLRRYKITNPPLYYIFQQDAKRIVIADLFMINPYDNTFSLVTPSKEIHTSQWESVLSQLERDYTGKKFLFFHALWGHPMLIPPFLMDNSLSPKQRRDFIQKYVETVVPIIRDNQIVLVNEPFTPSWEWADKRRVLNEILEEKPSEWIPWIFELAHKANPSATLILNEFGIEASGSILFDTKKADEVFNVVRKIKEKNPNIPIAVGFQMHVNPQFQELDPLIQGLISQIERYKRIGVSVIVTELDIRMDGERFRNLPEEERLLIQAQYYYRIGKVCAKYGVEINLFGASDRNSWLEETANGGQYAELTDPTVRDENNLKKIAWFELARCSWISNAGECER